MYAKIIDYTNPRTQVISHGVEVHVRANTADKGLPMLLDGFDRAFVKRHPNVEIDKPTMMNGDFTPVRIFHRGGYYGQGDVQAEVVTDRSTGEGAGKVKFTVWMRDSDPREGLYGRLKEEKARDLLADQWERR